MPCSSLLAWYISATSRLCLGYVSATSRLHLGYVSATSRLRLGYVSAVDTPCSSVLSCVVASPSPRGRGRTCRVEAPEMHPRCTRDVPEMHPRYTRATPETEPREGHHLRVEAAEQCAARVPPGRVEGHVDGQPARVGVERIPRPGRGRSHQSRGRSHQSQRRGDRVHAWTVSWCSRTLRKAPLGASHGRSRPHLGLHGASSPACTGGQRSPRRRSAPRPPPRRGRRLADSTAPPPPLGRSPTRAPRG